MAIRKNQHFVPKFYLKLFATDAGEHSIGLYNLRSRKYVPNASIRHQASSDYFYGKDGIVESDLEKLENYWAPAVRKVVNDLRVPKAGSLPALHLLMFMLNLSARTSRAGEEHAELVEKVSRLILAKDPRLQAHLDSIKIKTPEPNLIPMQTAFSMALVMMDMRCKLLVNRTEVPFIASDNPVVRTNPYLEQLAPHSSNTGFACKGLQVFLPLSPAVQLTYYDGSVYKFGSLGPRAVEVVRATDVEKLNLLQCLSTDENLYFRDISVASIERQLELSTPYRRAEKAGVREYRASDGTPDYIIHTQRRDIRCGLDLSFVRILEKAKTYNPKKKVVHVRNKEVRDIEREIHEAIKAGRMNLSDVLSQLVYTEDD